MAAGRPDGRRPPPAGEDGGVPYAYLAVTVFGAAAVLSAYRPIRREPFTVVCFAIGWPVSELPAQTIFLQGSATVLFVLFGALDGWAGYAGLAVALVSWAGLVGLAVVGARADRAVDAALRVPPRRRCPGCRPGHGRCGAAGGTWPRSSPCPDGPSRWSRTSTTGATGSAVTASTSSAPGGPVSGAPVMVYIHGGAWMIGDKREQGKPMMYELVARGWVCVTINYRLSPRATWPDHIVDCKRAIAWVHEHVAEYGGDPVLHRPVGGLGRRAPVGPGRPHRRGRKLAAGVRVRRHLGRRLPALLRGMDMTGTDGGSGKYGPGLLELLERR